MSSTDMSNGNWRGALRELWPNNGPHDDESVASAAEAVEWHTDAGGLYDDRRGHSGSKTVAQLTTELNEARAAAHRLYHALDTARHTARHLGHG